ncbi:MAG TPA: metallophosphoesterase [Terriglobales bacterium]|nr:metallophosphoesterase [Terriglobales bacterium]
MPLFSTHKISRRKFLYTGAVVATGAVLSVDGFAESNDPHIVRREISLKRLPRSFDGFTIAHVSDFHYEHHFSVVPIQKSVEMVNELRPDLIVLTGDFVTVPIFERQRFLRKSSETAIPCAALLGQLEAPKYAILGNHDATANPPLIIRSLEDRGIPVLRNRCVPIERGNGRVWLAGIDDLLRGTPRIDETLKGIPPDETTILLAHEPDFADEAANYPIDLQLSGHSHGGQIWIPGIGAPWLPSMSRKYPRGLYRVKDLTLYTNMGIGTIRAPIRLNCPPEVTLITLRSRKI